MNAHQSHRFNINNGNEFKISLNNSPFGHNCHQLVRRWDYLILISNNTKNILPYISMHKSSKQLCSEKLPKIVNSTDAIQI